MDADLTFLVTDIEDSTALWEHDAVAMEGLLARHDEILHAAVNENGGTVFKGTGDGILAVFDNARAAVAAAHQSQVELGAEPWPPHQQIRVRMGLDTGPAQERSGDYFGPPVNRVVRIMSSGHGGQVLLTTEALAQSGAEAIELGGYDYKGVGRVTVHQLELDAHQDFPDLRTDRTPPAITRAGFGKSIHGYELRQTLGEGDFGIVYQAHQSGVGREVAIKVIKPEYANQPSFIKRFEIEAKFVAQLEHPYIVPLYDFWRDPDGAYIVMRMLKGGSLRQSLDRAAWNPRAANRLIDQVGTALSYAHRNGVIHRDLKPANVLLDEDGNGYLSDFGIATRLVDETGAPVSSSRAYISPEELAGRRLTIHSDIYNFGVLIYEMLTGKRPPFGATLPTVTDERPDLPGALDSVIAQATASDPEERFDRVEELIEAFRTALGETDTEATVEAAQLHAIRNPYKGLRAFQETDRADFFGRDHLIDEILETVQTNPLTAVVGPSGSGKSSVVKAGLLPAVRAGTSGSSRDWLIADMFPGSYPFEELGAALMRVAVDRPSKLFDDLATDERGLVRASKRVLPDDGSGLLLVIDQFEEVFSLASEKDRDLFVASLVAMARDARSRVKVIVTLRADYFGYPLDYPEFAPLVRDGLVAVGMPNEQELTDAVTRPAEAVGLQLEPGLVHEVVHDVAEQPGGLPLMQYALTELYRSRDGRKLTLRAYQDSGGVLGALGRRAETIFQDLDGQAKASARQLFLRLVSVDEHSDDTRRRVKRADLDSLGLDARSLDKVMEEFGQYRLLTFDVDPITRGPTVEVAHEALIREWSRLNSWIGEHREDLVLERRLDDALREWEAGDRDASYLLRGSRLEQFEGWAAGSAVRLTAQQQTFLDESKAARRAEADREADRQAHERTLELRSQRRLRVLVAVMGVAALVAGVLGAFAVRQADEAETQREAAIDQRDEADQLRQQAVQQQQILDQQVIAFEAGAAAETAMETTKEDPLLAARQAQEAIAAAHTGGIPLTRSVEALHIALQELGIQFPAGDMDSATVVSPFGFRAAFVLPLADLLDLADGANIGQLSAAECEQLLGRACPSEPIRDRLSPEVLASSILEPSRAFPLLEGTDLRFDSSFVIRRDAVGGNNPVLNAGYFEELDAFSDATGIDPTSQNLTLRTGDSGGVQADYVILRVFEMAAVIRAIDTAGTPGLSLDPRDQIQVGTRPAFGVEAPITVGPIDVEQWIDADRLLSKEAPIITDALRSGAGLNAIWFAWHPWGIVYRTDIFEAQQLETPNSWEELVALTEELKRREIVPWCFGGSGGFAADYLATMVATSIISFEGPDFYDAWRAHEVPADDPRVLQALLRLEDLHFAEGNLSVPRSTASRRTWNHALGDMAGTDPNCAMWFADSDGAAIIDAPTALFRMPGPADGLLVSGSVVTFNSDRPETRQLARWLTLVSFGEQYSADGTSVAANVTLRNGFYDRYRDGNGAAADLVSEALIADALRVVPGGTTTTPVPVALSMLSALERWMEEGPEVLPEALAEVEAEWRAWEAEQQG